jgi:lipopolysaccharide transport system ATP-binding protein
MMNNFPEDLAIRVTNLSKKYRIGSNERYKTLRDTVMNGLKHLSPTNWGKPKTRTEIWALDDISFEVKHGEVIGIVGRNGAGKSTLLKLLSHITRPTIGQIEIRGRIGSLLEVGTGFHPELSGRENIYLNGAILGMKRNEIQRRFDEIVDFAEIDQFLDTPVKRYSSGMYMRLAFAVAAHLEPEILLVDEVLAVGDVAFQRKCLGKMNNIANQGRTVLFVSHNMTAIQQICQTGIMLHKGKIVSLGPVTDVVNRYTSEVALNQQVVKIEEKDHQTGINGVLVKTVRLLNGGGRTFSIPWQEPLDIEINLEVLKNIPHINFGAGYQSLEGFPILTVHQTDCGQDPWSLVPGAYSVRIRLDNPLRLGMYRLVIGAHEASAKSSIFYISDAIILEVISSSNKDTYYEHNTGIINGSGEWHLIRQR